MERVSTNVHRTNRSLASWYGFAQMLLPSPLALVRRPAAGLEEETETCMLVNEQGWANAQMLLSGPAVAGGDAGGQRVLPHPVKGKQT